MFHILDLLVVLRQFMNWTSLGFEICKRVLLPWNSQKHWAVFDLCFHPVEKDEHAIPVQSYVPVDLTIVCSLGKTEESYTSSKEYKVRLLQEALSEAWRSSFV